jgi:acyl CoA:acetate/3-ketoacid CoA transferase alpha subunit
VATLNPDGAMLLIGGFMAVGSPHRLIDAIVARGTCGLTVIAEPTHIVPICMITPDAVRTPGILVDYILESAS